jgi:hypothetical protein
MAGANRARMKWSEIGWFCGAVLLAPWLLLAPFIFGWWRAEGAHIAS